MNSRTTTLPRLSLPPVDFRERRDVPRSWKRPCSTRMSLAFVVLLFCVALQTTASEKETTARPSSSAIEQQTVYRLVEQLGSDLARERFAAEQSLLRMGPELLDILDRVDIPDSPAIEIALRRIRIRLEQVRSRATVRASMLTARGTFSRGELQQLILNQTGNRVDFSEIPEVFELPAIQWQKVPFWEALAELARQTDCVLVPRSRPARLVLVPESEVGSRPLASACGSSAFRIEVIRTNWKARQTTGLSKPLLRTTYRLLAEPRLQPLFLDYRDQDIVITSGATRLMPFDAQASRQPDFSGDGSTLFRADFWGHQETAPTTVDISLALAATVSTMPRPFRFPLNKNVPQTIQHGEVVVRLESIAWNPAPAHQDLARREITGTVRLTVRYRSGGPVFDSHRIAMISRDAYLLQGKRPLDIRLQRRTVMTADGAFSMEFLFRLPKDRRNDIAFLLMVPSAIIDVPLRFTIEDVPLPRP